MCETDTFFDRCSIVNESNHSFDTDLLLTIIYLSVCTPLMQNIPNITRHNTKYTYWNNVFTIYQPNCDIAWVTCRPRIHILMVHWFACCGNMRNIWGATPERLQLWTATQIPNQEYKGALILKWISVYV